MNTNREVSKLYEKKIKTGLSLCAVSSRNELVEQAVKFHISYKAMEQNPTLLEKTIASAASAAMQKTADRIASILFKLAVEQAKIIKLLSQFLDLEDIDLRELQREAYEEIMEIQGLLTLEKIKKEQRGE